MDIIVEHQGAPRRNVFVLIYYNSCGEFEYLQTFQTPCIILIMIYYVRKYPMYRSNWVFEALYNTLPPYCINVDNHEYYLNFYVHNRSKNIKIFLCTCTLYLKKRYKILIWFNFGFRTSENVDFTMMFFSSIEHSGYKISQK